ncbi:MAG: transposase [Bacteroidia bacterium]
MENKKYTRIRGMRANWWNYESNAAYFITIRTDWSSPKFGHIENKKMFLNEYGKVAEKLWEEIPSKFDFAELGIWVFMPDHMHGIIYITKDERSMNQRNEVNLKDLEVKSVNGGFSGKRNPMLLKSLGSIIRWYKARVSIELRKINPSFSWHTQYYDKIIKNRDEIQYVERYIINNPLNW